MLDSLSAQLSAGIRIVNQNRETILQSRLAAICMEAMKREAKHPACSRCCDIEDLLSYDDGGFALCPYCDCAINYVFNLRVDSVQGHVIVGPVWIAEKRDRPTVARLARRFGIGQAKFGQLAGKLASYSLEEFRRVGEMVFSAMRVIAQVLGTSLDLANEVTQLKGALLSEKKRTWQQMIKDRLTGAYRYNYGLARLKEEVARAEVYEGQEKRGSASSHSLSIAVIGVEEFRSYVEHHGPEAGRTFLKNMGTLLQKKCRRTDLSVRLSEEEFLLVLPSTGERGARVVVDRIREGIKSLPGSDAEGESNYSPSLVEGVATYPKDGQRGRELLRKALGRLRQ
jgi:diguanylate cyclase (GGDEF)-like protein